MFRAGIQQKNLLNSQKPASFQRERRDTVGRKQLVAVRLAVSCTPGITPVRSHARLRVFRPRCSISCCGKPSRGLGDRVRGPRSRRGIERGSIPAISSPAISPGRIYVVHHSFAEFSPRPKTRSHVVLGDGGPWPTRTEWTGHGPVNPRMSDYVVGVWMLKKHPLD